MLPRLRADIQLFPAEVKGQRVIGLKDMLGLTDGIVALRTELAAFLPLFDGEHSVGDLQQEMMRSRGNQLVMREEAEQLVRDLDALLMLESAAYIERKQEIRRQFAALESRPTALAGSAYPEDPLEARAYIDGMLAQAGDGLSRPPLRALIAPHIDLRVGGELYGQAYGRLPDSDFERIVVIGTGHYLEDGLFCLSGKRYETLLGSFPPDVEGVQRLRSAGGGCLAPDDFAHKNEHSIEFQVLFLRTVLKRDVPMITILAGSVGPNLTTRGGLAEIPGVAEFVGVLRELCGPQTLVVAGVDFCHVGPKFGHPRPAAVYESEFREHDRRLLEAISRGSGHELWTEAQRVQDRFHVCGLTTLAALLEVLPGSTGQVLGYDVWHEAATRSAVSFAAAVLL